MDETLRALGRGIVSARRNHPPGSLTRPAGHGRARRATGDAVACAEPTSTEPCPKRVVGRRIQAPHSPSRIQSRLASRARAIREPPCEYRKGLPPR
jgi:hypothetical protein